MALKVAVVGAGYLGQRHARIYSELGNVELAGVVDTDEDRAKEIAEKYSSRAYRDYRDTLMDVDALSIVVPTTEHFHIAMDCIKAGKDVLVEKPIAATVSQADELISEARKRNCILQVGHLERFNAGVVALSRRAGEPEFLEAVRLSPFLNRGFDVDVTLDLMIHDIDIILSLVSSPVREIRAFGFSLVTAKIDEARVWLGFENGAAASLTASRISGEKERRLKLFQKSSVAELDYQTGVVEFRSAENPLEPEVVRPGYSEPLKEELRDFIRCAEQRDRPKVSGVEGRNALRLALEIRSVMGRTQ
jgi:predicted dehydrogenase